MRSDKSFSLEASKMFNSWMDDKGQKERMNKIFLNAPTRSQPMSDEEFYMHEATCTMLSSFPASLAHAPHSKSAACVHRHAAQHGRMHARPWLQPAQHRNSLSHRPVGGRAAGNAVRKSTKERRP